MRLRIVPARRGALWVRDAFRLYFTKPLPFAVLFVVFLAGMLGMLMLPLVGSALLLLAMPFVTLGFMIASRRAREGQGFTPAVFIEALRTPGQRRKDLLRMATAYAVVTVGIILISAWVDGGSFDALQQAMMAEPADPKAVSDALDDSRLQAGMIVRFGLAALLALPFWHAPALIHWHGVGFAKSIFFSTVACWRSRTAFLAYGLAWLAVMVLFSLLARVVFGLMGEPRLLVLIALPAGLLFSTVFYVSLYDTFADSFDTDPAVGGDSAEVLSLPTEP